MTCKIYNRYEIGEYLARRFVKADRSHDVFQRLDLKPVRYSNNTILGFDLESAVVEKQWRIRLNNDVSRAGTVGYLKSIKVFYLSHSLQRDTIPILERRLLMRLKAAQHLASSIGILSEERDIISRHGLTDDLLFNDIVLCL